MDCFNRMVSEMMAEFGSAITVVIVGNATYDPATSQNTASETRYTARATVTDFTLQKNGLQAAPGTQIQMGDKYVLLEPVDTNGNPLPDLRAERDFLEFSNKRFKVVVCKESNPNLANRILYEILARS